MQSQSQSQFQSSNLTSKSWGGLPPILTSDCLIGIGFGFGLALTSNDAKSHIEVSVNIFIFVFDTSGLSQEIVPNLRSFTENWILRPQKEDFDQLYTIGSEFASRTRSHTPVPAVSAKNAVSENFYCQILRKCSEKFGTIFCENPLICSFAHLRGQAS